MLEQQLCRQCLGSNFTDLRWYCHEAHYSSTYHNNSIPHAWNAWMALCWLTWCQSSCGGSVGWQRVGEKEGKQQSDEAQLAIGYICKINTIMSCSSTYPDPTAKLSKHSCNQTTLAYLIPMQLFTYPTAPYRMPMGMHPAPLIFYPPGFVPYYPPMYYPHPPHP